MNYEPFVIERTYDAPVERVWSAITVNEEMKQWYFDIESFKPEVGFEFSFEGRDGDKVFVHLCKITEVEPLKKLAYSWTYKDYEGYSIVSFELSAEGSKTKLKLTHSGVETFPQDNPSFAKTNFAAGWNHIIGASLKEFLEKAAL